MTSPSKRRKTQITSPRGLNTRVWELRARLRSWEPLEEAAALPWRAKNGRTRSQPRWGVAGSTPEAQQRSPSSVPGSPEPRRAWAPPRLRGLYAVLEQLACCPAPKSVGSWKELLTKIAPVQPRGKVCCIQAGFVLSRPLPQPGQAAGALLRATQLHFRL